MNTAAFLGRGWSFPTKFGQGGASVQMSEGEQDIRESLRILFTTLAGERIMRPEYGGALERFVFERMSTNVITLLRSAIREAVLHFETRVALDEVLVDESRVPNGYLLFELRYRIVATNSRGNVVFPFYLNEGTNVPQR